MRCVRGRRSFVSDNSPFFPAKTGYYLRTPPWPRLSSSPQVCPRESVNRHLHAAGGARERPLPRRAVAQEVNRGPLKPNASLSSLASFSAVPFPRQDFFVYSGILRCTTSRGLIVSSIHSVGLGGVFLYILQHQFQFFILSLGWSQSLRTQECLAS